MWQSFSNYVAELSTNPWVTMSGWLVGILGGVVWLFKRGPRVKRPVFATERRIVIQDADAVHPELSIRFRDKPVSNLSVTSVYFWNDGGEAIRQEDFSRNDALRIVKPKDMEILHAEIAAVTSLSSGLTLGVEREDGSISLSFEHVGHNEGCQISILHTLSAHPITLAGTCINVGPVSRYKPGFKNLALSIGSPLLVFCIFYLLLKEDDGEVRTMWFLLAIPVAALVYGLVNGLVEGQENKQALIFRPRRLVSREKAN